MFIKPDRVRKSNHDWILLTSAEIGEEGVLLKATFIKESNEPPEPTFLLEMHGWGKGCVSDDMGSKRATEQVHNYS